MIERKINDMSMLDYISSAKQDDFTKALRSLGGLPRVQNSNIVRPPYRSSDTVIAHKNDAKELVMLRQRAEQDIVNKNSD